MSVLPMRPPNWRCEALEQASAVLRSAKTPGSLVVSNGHIEMLASALDDLFLEEYRIKRDPGEMPIVLPGMVVQVIGTETKFLVTDTVRYRPGPGPVYGIRGSNQLSADSTQVCRVWDQNLHLIWQMPEST